MITKLEIHGFKTFQNFEMEFLPLTIIAGPNASGKSNLFDALTLLSRLAETDLKTAFSEQRGEAIELFTKYSEDEYADQISFAVEMLVDKTIKDNWGGEYELKYTRLRYELKVKRTLNSRGFHELTVAHESLVNLKHDEDKWIKECIPPRLREYWRPKVSAGRRGKPYITTEIKNGIVTIKLPQDGKAGGKETPANAVLQTVLSGINSIDFPHVFAAKEQMREWRFLQLNPDALSKPSPYLAKDVIEHDGRNLAAALHRMKSDDPTILKDISRTLNLFLPNIIEIDVLDDTENKQFIVQTKNNDGRLFTSRVLSEGTLRLVALCVLLYDDLFGGTICFEEPENGIHPYRIKSMVRLLSELSLDFEDTSAPLRQVLVNTHSPVLIGEVMQLQKERNVSVWFSQLITRISNMNGERIQMNNTKMLPVSNSRQSPLFKASEEENRLTYAEVKNYLNTAMFPEELI